jgi:hypothetical protein
VQCLYTFKSICGITSKNGINFKLRVGWGIAGFASYPVANTIDGVARNFDISGVVSASQNTNLDLGNPNLQPELYSEVELDLKLNWTTELPRFFLLQKKN